MPTLPMFPLGSALLPGMPLALRVFEPRYLALLADILDDEPSEFGVVLIERGQEVGGGDQRFDVGTVARIERLEAGTNLIGMLARGDRRFTVREWLDDDPYPRAEVDFLPDPVWDDALADRRAEAERVVRAALSMAAESGAEVWPADVDLEDDPLASCWQLAGIAPVSTLDRVAFLRSTGVEDLLHRVVEETVAATEALGGGWPD